MQKLTREEYNSDAVMRMVHSVTFLKNLANQDQAQFELLLSVSRFMKYEQGEVLMNKGESADSLYFLLKGQVSVFTSSDDQSSCVLNPGEVVGTMSMVTGGNRSATVKAHSDVVLLSLEYVHCNDINDYGLFNLHTKLMAYRMVIHHIRWTLELNKMKYPNHELTPRIFKMPIYSGDKDTQEELLALHEQARLLAELLREWNDSLVESMTTNSEPHGLMANGLAAS